MTTIVTSVQTQWQAAAVVYRKQGEQRLLRQGNTDPQPASGPHRRRFCRCCRLSQVPPVSHLQPSSQGTAQRYAMSACCEQRFSCAVMLKLCLLAAPHQDTMAPLYCLRITSPACCQP